MTTAVHTDLVTIETNTHTIEISDGCLTIGEHTFPDNCVTLSQEETQAVVDTFRSMIEDVLQRGKEGSQC